MHVPVKGLAEDNGPVERPVREGRTVEKAHAQRRCKQGREKNIEGFL